MGERRGRPVAGWIIGVGGVMAGLGLGAAAYGMALGSMLGDSMNPAESALFLGLMVGAGVLGVGGPVLAWRVGRGHWGLRRRHTEPLSPV